MQCYKKAIGQDGDNFETYKSKGEALTELGRYEEAVQCYDEMMKTEKGRVEGYKSKGEALENLGR